MLMKPLLSALCLFPALLALLISPRLQAEEPAFTLAAVLDYPQAEALLASPVDDRVVWVSTRRGVRNIWMAEAPDWQGRQLTRYDEDDGQAITELRFSPDGAALFYLRGGAPNRDGDLPNPLSDPRGVKRELWQLRFAGGEAPRALVETGRYAVFPDGQQVAYLREGQLHVLPLSPAEAVAAEDPAAAAGSEEEQSPAQPLFSVRKGIADFRIAPDGSALAFVSDRGDHAFVGVYHIDSGSLVWMKPSLDHDQSPVWSPDGTQLAFLRVPNEKLSLPFEPRRDGLPWSIQLADPHSGESREIFRADPGVGSAFQPGYWFVGDHLWWTRQGRIVFPWEKSGWLHLWSIDAAGGETIDLTPGEGEVQYAQLAPGEDSLLVSANHGDLHRRHLWQLAPDRAEAESLTQGDGIEWLGQLTGAGTLVFLAADARRPAHPVAIVSGERRVLAPAPPPAFPLQALVEPEPVSFRASDGMRIHAQLFRPPASCGDGPHPGLLFFHGGSRRQMLLGFHPSTYYANAYAFNQAMAARCFVVAAVNYRSGVGYGMHFREALDYGARGAAEYRDVVGAGLYLAARADVDPARLGLWGGSYGGYLTALGLARASDLFAAGVDLHGVHDWNVVINNFVQHYDPAARADFAQLAYASSPMAYLKGWRSPVLLIHGDDDRNVPFSESVDLAEALRRQGTPMESLVFPDEVHGFLLHRNWLAAYEAAADFLQRELAAR